METLRDDEKEFYRKCGLAYELEPGERACAVIRLRTSAAQDAVEFFGADAVRRLAQALETWKAGQPRVRRILGLESMLEGRLPEVATFLVWGRYYMDDDNPGTWIMPLALVTGDREAEDDIAASLAEIVDGCGMGESQAHARYLYDYR